jgi:RecB family endonuclease NucS
LVKIRLNSSSICVLENPTLENAIEIIREAVDKKEVLIIVGNCRVKYTGRASSKLELGERILIIKRDGAFLIHRPGGYQPVNWMSGKDTVYHLELIGRKEMLLDMNNSKKTDFKNRVEDPPQKIVLKIQAIQRTPAELIRVFFDQIHLLSTLSLEDTGRFSLYASEEDMKKAILLKPELIEKGFKVVSYEKRTDTGFVDVYGADEQGRFVIVEIKRKTAGKAAMLQLAKYRKSVEMKVNRDIRCVLAAPKIAKGTQRLLATLNLEFKRLDPKRCAAILNDEQTQRAKISDFI